MVVMCRSFQVQVEVVAVVHQLRDADITGQGVTWCRDDHLSVAVAALVIIESRQVTFQVDVAQVVIDEALQGDGGTDVEGDLGELLQPVALTDGGVDGEIIVCMRIHLRQSGQGRQLAGYEVGEALCQCLVVEVAPYLRLGEVAVQQQVVDFLVISRLEHQVVHLIVFLLVLIGKFADMDETLGVVRAGTLDIGVQIEADSGVVNATLAIDLTFGIAAVQLDVLVAVVIVLKGIHHTIDMYLRVAFGKTAVQSDIGDYGTEPLVVEQLSQVDARCLYLANEVLLGIQGKLYGGITGA